jgi:hypothetical protein
MNLSQNCTAISAWLLLTLLGFGATAHAGPMVGTVTHASGLLFAKNVDGTLKFLSENSVVEQGDTLISEKNTYAQIHFTDNSEITLRPNSQVSIEDFSYDEAKPQSDNVVFNLHKGGLEVISGLVAKRSERFSLKTSTASITVRDGRFIAEYVTPEESTAVSLRYKRINLAAVTPALLQPGLNPTMSDAPSGMLPAPGLAPLQLAALPGPIPAGQALPPGLYVQVIDGLIHVTNPSGTTNFSPGQFGFTPNLRQPPVILPSNPGMQFMPPPSFSSSSAPQVGTGNSGKSNIDCVVR